MADPGTLTRGDAASALASLTWVKDGTATAMVLVTEAENGTDVSQLEATPKASTALVDWAHSSATRYRSREVIDYDVNEVAASGQAMWLRVAEVPTLQSIMTEADDLANLPLFDPKTANWAGVRLSAVEVKRGNESAVFLQSLSSREVIARSKNFGVIVRKGKVDVPPSGELVLLGGLATTIVSAGIAFFANRGAFQRLLGLPRVRLTSHL